MVSFIQNVWKNPIHGDRKQTGGCQKLRVGRNEEYCLLSSVWDDEVLKLDGGDDGTTL